MPRSLPKPRVTHTDFVAAWLNSSADPKFTTFTCTVLSEVGGARPSICRALSDAVFLHHQDPETYRKKLAHLGYPATAAALDRRPKAQRLRKNRVLS